MTILSVDLFLIDLGMNFIPCDSLEIHAPKSGYGTLQSVSLSTVRKIGDVH